MKTEFFVKNEAEMKESANGFIRTHGGYCHETKYPCGCTGKTAKGIYCASSTGSIFARYIICEECATKEKWLLRSYPIGGNGRSMVIADCETREAIDRALASYIEIQQEAGFIATDYGQDIRIKNCYLRIEPA